MTLPTDPNERKSHPIYSGVLQYFPDAIAEVANASWVGNEQHHAREPLHWDKSKSTDEADCLLRHLMQAGTRDVDGVRHTAKAAWRALALLQRELETERAKQVGGNCHHISCIKRGPFIGEHVHELRDSRLDHPAATSFKEQWEPQSTPPFVYGC